jgi:Peptidase propeptide and YPEB domain
MRRLSLNLISFALAVATPAMAQGPQVTVKETRPGLLARAKVSADAAIATAQARVPKGKLDSAEIEEEGGKLIYSFDFKTPGRSGIDEVNVDAITGKPVGKVEHESPAAEAKEKAAEEKGTKPRAKKPPRWMSSVPPMPKGDFLLTSDVEGRLALSVGSNAAR